MKAFFFSIALCSDTSLLAQTNSSPRKEDFFCNTGPQLRSWTQVTGNVVSETTGRTLKTYFAAQMFQPVNSAAPNSISDSFFEARTTQGKPNGFSALSQQIYERLERDGYFAKPQLADESRLDSFLKSTFEPEVFHLRKVSVTCSLVTAIKHKNPLCLINPFFLDVRW